MIPLQVLKPIQTAKPTSSSPLPGILNIYDELRSDEKKTKHKRKLREAFAGADAEEEMKFSHSIQFNAVPDWSNQYIAYSNLKKLIYTLEKEVNQRVQALVRDAESTSLLDNTGGDPDKAFAQALDHELRKVEAFYDQKEAEIFKDVDDLLQDEEALTVGVDGLDTSDTSPLGRKKSRSGSQPRRDSLFKQFGLPGRRRPSVSKPMMERIDSEDSDDDQEGGNLLRRVSTASSGRGSALPARARRRSSAGQESESDAPMTESTHAAAATKKRMVNSFVSLCELKSYLELNKTGFTKVLKKYDKTLDRKLKPLYLRDSVEQSQAFQPRRRESINDKISLVEQTYADVYTDGDNEKAKRELRLDLREHVVWERNTVWREMIGIERKAQAAHIGARPPLLGKSGERKQGDETPETKELATPAGRLRLPRFLFNSSIYILVLALAVFGILLSVPILELPEQQNCLAMTVFVSILWATEVG